MIFALVLALVAPAAPVAAQGHLDPVILEKHEIPVHNMSDKWVWMTADRYNPIGSDTNIRYWCLAPGQSKTEVIVLNSRDNLRWIRFQVTRETKCNQPVIWDHKFERQSWVQYILSGKDGKYAVTTKPK